MDRKLLSECLAMLLLFAAFPIISIGATNGNAGLWWIGLSSLILGGALPVWTRFMDHSNDTVRDLGVEFDDRVS